LAAVDAAQLLLMDATVRSGGVCANARPLLSAATSASSSSSFALNAAFNCSCGVGYGPGRATVARAAAAPFYVWNVSGVANVSDAFPGHTAQPPPGLDNFSCPVATVALPAVTAVAAVRSAPGNVLFAAKADAAGTAIARLPAYRGPVDEFHGSLILWRPGARNDEPRRSGVRQREQ
jgi:hypothetical protein